MAERAGRRRTAAARAAAREYPARSLARGRTAVRRVGARFPCGRTVDTEVVRRYLDSFDWRLFAKGRALVFERGRAGGASLLWTTLDGRVLRRLVGANEPTFARDLPAGPFREALLAITGVRRLFPHLEVTARERTTPVLDERSKTVVRLVLTHAAARRPDAAVEAETLEPVARVVPLRGYEREFAKVVGALESDTALGRPGPAELERAAVALALDPRAHSGRIAVTLDPLMRADDATRAILRGLLSTLRLNEPGARADLDPEFLHDFRVAVRRTRSALGRIREVFPPEARRRFADEFRWLGRLTGPKRDLDVYLETMPTYRAMLPDADHAALGPLVAFLEHQRSAAQAELVAGLGSARHRELLERWQAFLDGSPAAAAVAPDAARPVIALARERIWRAWRRLRRDGRRITDDDPPERLHELRIDGKKMRYLLEFFASLWPAAELHAPLERLRRLQELLGELNDLRVQRQTLRALADRLAEADRTAGPTLIAMGRLVERLAERQRVVREGFAERFAELDVPTSRACFRKLFRPPRVASP